MKISPSFFKNILLVITMFLNHIKCSITFSDKGTIEIKKKNETAVYFEYYVKKGTWVGIGFNDSMKNCDMHVVNVYSNGNVDVLDTYSKKSKAPPIDESYGSTNDVREISKVDKGDYMVVSYTRLLKTGDPYDADLSFNTSIPFNVAWMDGDMENNYHASNYYITSIRITENPLSSGEKNKTEIFWHIHGIGLLVAWTAVTFLGYISARFLKHYTFWLILHFLGGTLPSLFTIGVSIAAILKTEDNPDQPAVYSLHTISGLVFLGIISIHVIFGYVSLFGIYKSKGAFSNLIIKQKIIHKVLGIFLTFVSHLLTITGFLILYPSFYGIPLALCCLSFIILIILELIHFKKNQNKSTLIAQTFDESNKTSIENITFQKINEEKSKKKFVFYENLLLDITSYYEEHPGGKNMLLENLYGDVSRYITGNQAYSSKVAAYDHNLETCVYAIKSLAYAKFEDNHGIIVKNEKTAYLNDELALISQKEIGEFTSQLNFSLAGTYKVPIFLAGISWIGRHFAISSKELNKTRYYSLCLCLNENIQEKINILLKNVTSLENKKEIENLTFNEKIQYADQISFYVKKYSFKNALSSHLHSLKEKSNNVNIRGPIGVGLALPEKLSGTYLIAAGGTGVLPYLDFAFYVIRYIVDKISKSSFKFETNKLDENESFSEIQDDFKLILMFSYTNKNQSFMDDILKNASDLDRKYTINKLEYIVRFNTDKKWDQNFIKEKLIGSSKQNIRAYFCGPVGFMEFMKNIIVETDKVELNNIYFT